MTIYRSAADMQQRARPKASPPRLRTSHAVRLTEQGGVILTATRDQDDDVVVTAIQTLPARLAEFDARLRELCDPFPKLPPDTAVIIDGEGLGKALWLGLRVERRRAWLLYERRAKDRQELADSLRAAQYQRRVHIVSDDHAADMREGLKHYRVEVGDDGVIGGNLVVALALAVAVKPPPVPRIW